MLFRHRVGFRALFRYPNLIYHSARFNDAIHQGDCTYATVDEMKVNLALCVWAVEKRIEPKNALTL